MSEHLAIEHATRYLVPVTWDGDAADLCVSRDRHGAWSAGVTPTGWATLWLCDTTAQPWGRWRSNVSEISTFPTARAAYDAALATDQLEEAS